MDGGESALQAPAGMTAKEPAQGDADASAEKTAKAPSRGKGAFDELPSWTNDSFSCFRPITEEDASPLVHIVARPLSAIPLPPPPVVVLTDTTKCLIRALRLKPDPAPMQSAALAESRAPAIVQLQKAQRRQQQAQVTKNASLAAVARRRQLTAAPAGLAPAADPTAPRSAKAAARGSAGDAPGRPPKRARLGGGFGALAREKRQVCIRVALAAAMQHSPSAVVSELNRVWKKNPASPQRVTSEIRRELAESTKNWSVDELMAYVEGAALGRLSGFTIGLSKSRRELAVLVRENLMPA